MGDVKRRRVGRYELLGTLDGAPDSRVHLACDELGRRVVLKLHGLEDEDPGLAELGLLGLAHPGLAACLDAGRVSGDGELYTVTRLVEGAPLGPAALGERPLARDERVLLAARLLAALAVVHERGLLHRDIKDDNVLLEREGRRPVLIDFGLSCPIDEAADRPLSGTPRAFAPELFAGASASIASELWAVGLVLTEAILGRRIFDATEDTETLKAQRDGWRGLSDEDGALVADPSLAQLLDRLLARAPADRPEDAAAALAALPLEHGAPVDALFREELVGRRMAARARHDPRPAVIASAARRGRVWVDLAVGVPTTVEEACSRLLDAARSVDEPGASLRARLAAAEARPSTTTFVALARELATVRPLTLGVGADHAGGLGAADDGRALVAALERLPGVELFAEPAPRPEQAVDVVRDWLGPRAVLEERLRSVCPPTWTDLDQSLSELVRDGVVALGHGGLDVDEERLRATWPLETGASPTAGLDADALVVLELLALSPVTLAEDELERLAGRDPAEALAALRHDGLVEAVRGADGEAFALVDPRVRRSLRARPTLPADTRTALARHLSERSDGDVSEALAVALSDILGGSAPGADPSDVTDLLAAGAATLRRAGRPGPAASLLRRALQGAPADAPRRRALHIQLVDALVHRTEIDAASAAAEQARDELGDDAGLAVRRARILQQQGRPADAERILADVDLSGAEREDVIATLQLRGELRRSLGRLDEAVVDIREALRRQADETNPRMLQLLHNVAGLERALGDYDEAIRNYERCIDLAPRVGREFVIHAFQFDLGRTIIDRGERRRGLAVQEEAARRCEQAGDRTSLARFLNGIGAEWVTLGRADRGRRMLTRALRLSREIGEQVVEAMALNNTGRAYAAEGRLDDAEESFAASLALREERGDEIGQAAVAITRGRFRVLRGRTAGAAEDLARARRHLEGRSTAWDVEVALLDARLALAEGRAEDGRDAARRALEQAESLGLAQEAIVARDLAARAGGDDLEDFDVDAVERGPWVADLLFTRADRRHREGRRDEAGADVTSALSILGEIPHGPIEARGLVLRLGHDVERLASLLAAADQDFGPMGALLSRAATDLDRARVLVEMHDLAPLAPDLERHAERLAEMDRSSDTESLSSLSARLRDLERLVEINKELNTERDNQKLLDVIIDSAIELTGAARGFLILMDGKAEEFRAARNIDESTIHDPQFHVSHSVARAVVREGQPLLTANAIDDPRLASAASISELKLLSILCVPLVSRHKCWGAVYLDHPQVVGRFNESHLNTVTALAEQASIALANAMLSEGLEVSNRELLSSREEIARLNEALRQRLDQREAELEEARESLDASRRALALKYDYSSIVTRSPRMHEVLDFLDRIIDTDYPVVIYGESGTGKELIARAIHFNGPRQSRNFLSINCAAIAQPLIESELFGSVRGAFTGADRDRKGLFEQAHQGTLFLDEVGDMSLDVQKRLLRVLQEGEFLPVGGREVKKVDVRILCATHRDLMQGVEGGTFREDLYYRLAVARIDLPPLRERSEDIALLLPHFMQRHGGDARPIDPEALALLSSQPWPGNVREVENFAMNLLLLEKDGARVSADLVRRVLGLKGAEAGSETPAARDDVPLKARLEEYERQLIRQALERSGGNKSQAARELGVGIRSFYKMLERLGL